MEAPKADPAPVDDGNLDHPPVLDQATARRCSKGVHVGCEHKDPARITRAPITGLAALAWNAHHDACRLENHQRQAITDEAVRLNTEARRLEAEADRIEGASEARRVAILRAILNVQDGPVDVDQGEDGTLYAVEGGP